MSYVWINQRSENLTNSSCNNKIVECIYIIIFKLSENIEIYNCECFWKILLSLNLFHRNQSLDLGHQFHDGFSDPVFFLVDDFLQHRICFVYKIVKLLRFHFKL